jgi:aspartate aminotransferase
MIDSVSKRYSMWTRIGCVLFLRIKINVTAMKFASAFESTTFAQVAEAALDTPQSFDEVISEYRERRDTLVTELNKLME